MPCFVWKEFTRTVATVKTKQIRMQKRTDWNRQESKMHTRACVNTIYLPMWLHACACVCAETSVSELGPEALQKNRPPEELVTTLSLSYAPTQCTHYKLTTQSTHSLAALAHSHCTHCTHCTLCTHARTRTHVCRQCWRLSPPRSPCTSPRSRWACCWRRHGYRVRWHERW